MFGLEEKSVLFNVELGKLPFIRCSSRSEVFLKVLLNQQACNFILKRLCHKCFPVNLAKNIFYTTPLLAASAY